VTNLFELCVEEKGTLTLIVTPAPEPGSSLSFFPVSGPGPLGQAALHHRGGLLLIFPLLAGEGLGEGRAIESLTSPNYLKKMKKNPGTEVPGSLTGRLHV